MADNKLTTLFNKVDLAGLASAGSAPVNIDRYKQVLNEVIYAKEAATTKPDDYDGIDWSKDWVTDFQVKRNEINYQTKLGDIIQQLEDLDNIAKAKRYIDNQKEISKYLNALREDPSKLEYKLQALNIAKQNDIDGLTDAYNKVVVNKAGGLDNQKTRLDWLENDTKSKVDGYLKEAYEYKDNAEYWANKHKISDYYLAKQAYTAIDFTNLDTYLFRTSDLMGSSASSWKSQIVGTVGAAIASSAGVAAGAAITAGSGGVALPLGIAVAGAGVSVASNIYSRSEESKAEVFSNYKSRVFNNADNAGITDKVLENAKKLLIAANKNNPNYELPSDDEIKDKILVGELKSGNEKFDDIRIKSLKGLDNLYTQNMALSGWDIAENVLQVMPIGLLAKGSKAIGKITSKATGLKGAISKRIDDVVMAGIDRVPTNLARITKRKAIASIAGRTVLTGIGEGAEEGTQYIRGKEYERGAYDDREDNYLEAIVGNIGVGARSVFAALTPFDSAYSSDKEFLDNFKGGALLGGLTTAVVSPLAAYKPLKDKIRAEELVSKLYADRFAERDAILKSEFYAEAAKNNKAANIYDAFEELKKMNIEGADLDAINAEQERANRIINLASSRQIKELAIKNNIDPKSDDYNTFVALYDHHTNLVQESIKNLSTTSTELSKILQRQDVNEFAEQKNKENPELVKKFAYLQALKSKLEQLSKKYADDIALAEEKSNANGVNIPTQDLHENKKIVDGMLNQTNKDINGLRGKELNEEDSANFNINDYEIPTAHDDMAKAVEAMIYSNIDNVRNLKGLLNFVTSESEDKGKAKESVDKYKETVEENELVIQDLNDAARGNIPTQEQVKEEVEVKQPVVEPLPAQEAATTEKEDKSKGDAIISTTKVRDGLSTTTYKKQRSDGKIVTGGGLQIAKEDIPETELEAIEDFLKDVEDVKLELLEFRKSEDGRMAGTVRVRGELKENGIIVADNYEFKFDKDFSGKTAEETATEPISKPSLPLSTEKATTEPSGSSVVKNDKVTINFKDPSDPTGSENQLDFDLIDISYGSKRDGSGKSKMIDIASRKIVLVNINGTAIPFYCSTGSGGKATVASGKWYPFFGIGNDGWMNKGTESQINSYYGHPLLKLISEQLDRLFGDVLSRSDIPMSTSGEDMSFEEINKNLKPTSNRTSKTIENVNNNIAEVKSKLDAYLSEVTSKSKELQKEKELQKGTEAPELTELRNQIKATREATTTTTKVPNKYKRRGIPEDQLYSVKVEPNLDTAAGRAFENANNTLKEIFDVALYSNNLALKVNNSEYRVFPKKDPYNSDIFYNELSKLQEVDLFGELYLLLHDARFKLEEATINLDIEDINKYTDEVNTILAKYDSLKRLIAELELKANEEATEPFAADKQQEVPAVTTDDVESATEEPVAENIPTTDNVNLQEVNKPLVMDRGLDKWSRMLQYFTPANTTFDGYSGYEGGAALGEALMNPDFLATADVSIVVKPYTNKTTNVTEQAVYIEFKYKGKNYVAALHSDNYNFNNIKGFRQLQYEKQQIVLLNLKALRDKIIKLNEIVKNNPNYKIVPTSINKTNGVINSVVDKEGNPVNTNLQDIPLFNIKNIYDITPENTPIGIATGPTGSEVIRVGGKDLYANGKQLGAAYYMLPVNVNGKTFDIPIRLNTKPFKGDNAVSELILKLVTDLNNPNYTTADGEVTPFSHFGLLKLIVNFGSHTATNPELYSPDLARERTKKQFYIDKDDSEYLVLGQDQYRLADLVLNPDGTPANKAAYDKAKQYIMDNFHWSVEEDNLWKWFAGENTLEKGHPLGALKAWFQINDKLKLTIIPGELEFTKDDVTANGSGISMVGWYIKNNILTSNLNPKMPFKNPNIYMLDVMLVNDTENKLMQAATEKIEKEVAKVEEAKETGTDSAQATDMTLDDIFADLGPNYGIAEPVANNDGFINKEYATNYLKRVLGLSEDDVVFVPTIIEITRAGFYVLGRASLDSITLSEQAPAGVEYHEAWHRVSNLLISENKRKKIFKRINKDGRMTEAEIDEILAELFRDFMNYALNKIDFETTNWFRKIYNFIKTFAKVGNYRLAKMYYDINVGRFSNVKPSAENIERFKRIYEDGPDFKHRGTNYATIRSSESYNTMISSLFYALLRMNFGNIYNVKYEDLSKLDFDVLRTLISNQYTKFNNPAMKEILDNFDNDIAPAISDLIAKLGGSVKLEIEAEEQALSDIEGGETEAINVGEHTKASYETSIVDKAPYKIKFFFKTVPAYVFDEANNKVTVATDPITGLPRFVDSGMAWKMALNKLHDVRSVSDMINRINQLSQTDRFFLAVATKLNQLDPIKDEQFITKLYTIIRSSKHLFITGKISTLPNKKSKVDIIDNTVDVQAITYPKIWSQMLFYNLAMFSVAEDGVVYADADALLHLRKVRDRFYKIYEAFISGKGKLTLGDKQYDFTSNLEDQERLKKLIVMLLNEVGVAIDLPTIANMMSSGKANGYADPLTSDTYTLLKDFITSGKYSLKSLFDRLGFIASSVKENGSIDFVHMGDNKIDIRQFYNESGFIKALAQSYAKVHAGSEDLKSLGASNNILYPISLNNFVFDRVAELNEDALVVNELNDVTYNKGSLMLSQLASRRKPKVSAETLVNFRTDDVGDQGRDYFQITDREDYIMKMSLAMSNRILFPTIADKKTYHVLNGFKLPHERITWEEVDGGLRPTFGSETIAQFMAYANAELATIEQTLNDLDPNNPNRIPNDRLIKNYHTPVEYKVDGLTYYVSPNGTRFRFLTGIYIVVNGKELFIDFNAVDKSKTPELALQKARLNLQLAKDYFFNNNIDGKTKADFISTLIAKAVEKEINKAAELGLILKLAGDNIYGLRNSLLDNDAIETRTSHYLNLEAAPDIVKTNAEGYAVYDAIADYAVNSIISINEVERIFSGDPAFYKWAYTEDGMVDNTVDKIKRLGSVTSTGTNNRLDFEDLTHTDYTVAELNDIEIGSKQFDTLEELFIEGNIRDAVGDNEDPDPDIVEAAKLKARAEVGGYKEGINIADAAVYVSPTMYRNMMRMIGEWSPEVEEAFLILTNPETELSWYDELELYRKVTKASLKPLKYMAFGFRTKEQQGLGIPYFNKMALFPVFKTIATGDMADLYERMTATGKYSESNPIDMVMFNSAVKVGSRAPKDYYANGDTDVTDLNKLTVYKQSFKYLRQQLATDPHVHEELMAGTQFLKVGLSNIDQKAKYGNDSLGYMLGEQIANSIFEYMNILSDHGKLEIYDKLFDESGNLSIEKLGKMLSDDAKQSDMNDNVIDALLVIDGKFKLPLSAISGTSVDNRFISMLNKAVIDIHLPGGSFIQRSSFGVKAGDGLSVISDKYLNGGKRLKLLNEDGSMDAIVSINLFKHIIPGYNKMTFRQAKQWLIDNNIIGENAEPNAIGYRIPTQSIASISPLKFVDVFPEVMGDTVVLPDEFTKLTGSDFDIDKLYIARYQYKNGSKKGLSETDTIKNAMLEMYMRILTTVRNTNQLKASIDTATGGVKAILKDVERGRKLEPIKPFMSYLPSFQEDKKSEYTKGKSGIGPMALNNAHHVLTQLQNCRFKSNPFVDALGIKDLNKVLDDASLSEPVPGRVLDWLSAMINAFVDIAKDPYIVRLNVNDYTYNMISLLLRTGKGKQSFYFLSQPILKDIAIEVAKNKGRYGVDLSKTNAQLERDAIDTVLRKYDPSGSYIKEFTAINYDNFLMAGVYDDLFTEYAKPDGTITSRMRELLLMNKDDITQGVSNYARELIRVYFAFKALKPYADELANLVKYSKIDTKKMGNTFAQQRIFAAGIELMKKKSLFEAGDVANFFDKTFLQRKYENSILFGSTIFNDVLLTNTDGFLDLQDIILLQLGRSTNATEKITKPVINALSASIKSGFFNERMAKKGLRPRTMFYGSESMAKRLLRIKNNILKGKYEEFKDGNTLLDFLLPNIVVNSVMSQDPDLIDTSSIFTAENTTANDLINSWLLMLESDIELVRLFADDLVDYAFITSGDNKNPNSFFEYFPNDFRLSIGYADYVSRVTDIYAAGQAESFNIDDIYLNNWNDDALVKRIPEMYYDKDGNTRSLMTIDSSQIFPGTNRKYPLVIFGKRNNMLKEGKIGNTTYTEFIDENGLKIVKPAYSRYIKVKIGKTNNPESWAVYKLVGVSKVADGKNPDKIHEYPVYQVVNKKGYKYRGHTITEYGRNDWHKFNILPELYDFKSNLQSGLIVNHIAGIELMNPNYWSDLMGLILGTVDVNDNNAAIDNKSMTEEEIDSIEDVEPSVQVPTEKLVQSNEKQSINIYAGTNENANLSNFAIRPFLIDGEEFKSVEQYFLYVKKDYVIDDITEELFWHNHKIALLILNTTDGAELRRLGKLFQALDVSRWDKASTIEMKKAITASFEDNPDSLQLLLNTGNSILTHNLDKSKWGTEFPRILMEVRNKFLANMNKSKSQSKLETTSELNHKTYSGTINKLEQNQIFVFGSNTQGRHGKGAALTAKNNFGAVYGLAEGIQGNSYGIITKDLTKTTHPSRTVEQIKEQISNLYKYALLNPDKEFLVAYSGTGSNLNAYSNKEMADMFSSMPIPNNVIFEENFDKLLTRNKTNVGLSGLDLVDMYVAAEKQLREELTQLGLSEADITTKFNEFATILRNNNINTKDAIFEALRKYICNL